VHPQVVGVGIRALLVGIGDDHLRPVAPDHRDQPADRLVQRRVGERVGRGVLGRVGHAGIAVSEQLDRVVADDLGCPGQLPEADGGQVGPDLGAVHRRVEDVAGLAAGAGDQHRTHAFGVVAGHRGGPFRGLVVGVGVHGQQAQSVVGHRSGTLPVRFARPTPGSRAVALTRPE
jgi:hypothetical protein